MLFWFFFINHFLKSAHTYKMHSCLWQGSHSSGTWEYLEEPEQQSVFFSCVWSLIRETGIRTLRLEQGERLTFTILRHLHFASDIPRHPTNPAHALPPDPRSPSDSHLLSWLAGQWQIQWEKQDEAFWAFLELTLLVNMWLRFRICERRKLEAVETIVRCRCYWVNSVAYLHLVDVTMIP